MRGDPLEAVAWSQRAREFGQLVARHDKGRPVVAMSFAPQPVDERWSALKEAWLRLPPHPHIVEALGTSGMWLLLRYAAIEWARTVVLGPRQGDIEATWVAQLAMAYQHIWTVAGDAIDVFASPLIRFDIGGELRVLFRPWTWTPGRTPYPERALVQLVGSHSRDFVTDARIRDNVISRCLRGELGTLHEVVHECRHAGASRSERRSVVSAAWSEIEEGIGWLELEGYPARLENAAEHFGYALDYTTHADQAPEIRDMTELARWGRDYANDRRGSDREPRWSTSWPQLVASETNAYVDWASAAAWRKRDFAFGDLRVYDDGRPIIAMEYLPGTHTPNWQSLRGAWLAIERSCAILDSLAIEKSELLIRYAALNWKLEPLLVNAPGRERTAAAWLVDIIDAYQVIVDEQPEEILQFLNPVVRIDLNLRPRIAFLASPAERHELPPEAVAKQPTWDERSLVGTVMKRLVRFDGEVDTPFRMVLDSCTQDRPWKRWKSLAAILEAVGVLGFDVDELRRERRPIGWDDAEEGLGWLEIGENERALASFEAAAGTSFDEMAAWGKNLALERIETAKRADETPPPDPERLSQTASGSIDVKYAYVPPSGNKRLNWPAPLPEVVLGRAHSAVQQAREALHLGDVGYAATFANQARVHEETRRAATIILAEVHLRRRMPNKALELVEPLLAEREDAAAVYVRAKALFAAGRLHDARLGFERAFTLAPSMLEAMLLRREVDRALGSVRAKVGEANAVAIDVPAGLSDLRDVLLSGDARRAISALEDERYAKDAEAQLVLARFLTLDGQHERALDVYDHVAEPHRFTALLGKATTLLALERAESALAVFDQLIAEKPADAEASEGRARALEKLGRIGEAAAEYRRFISLATVGSDLRVRAAQAWLDAHPL